MSTSFSPTRLPLSQAWAAGHLSPHPCSPLGRSQWAGTQPGGGTCKPPRKLLLPFQAVVRTGLASCSQCQDVLRKSGLSEAFLPWDSLGEGFLRMSFHLLCITSREIPCGPYWWWWWWLVVVVVVSLSVSIISVSFLRVFFFLSFFLVAGLP